MDNDVVKTLLEINKELTQHIVELSKELAAMKSPEFAVAMAASTVPLHTPESEEDAQFLLDTGQIDKREYESLLKEIGFYSSEITTPGDLSG